MPRLIVRQTDPRMDRPTESLTDRQRDLHIDRQAGTSTNSYIETNRRPSRALQMDRETTHGQTGWHKYKQLYRDKQMNRWTDKQIVGQTDRELDRRTETTHGQTGLHKNNQLYRDKQTNRLTDKHMV
jgi:hypothetical protein